MAQAACTWVMEMSGENDFFKHMLSWAGSMTNFMFSTNGKDEEETEKMLRSVGSKSYGQLLPVKVGLFLYLTLNLLQFRE